RSIRAPRRGNSGRAKSAPPCLAWGATRSPYALLSLTPGAHPGVGAPREPTTGKTISKDREAQKRVQGPGRALCHGPRGGFAWSAGQFGHDAVDEFLHTAPPFGGPVDHQVAEPKVSDRLGGGQNLIPGLGDRQVGRLQDG